MPHAALSRLPAFLVEAKKCTYAGLDDAATMAEPALPGSRQLEHGAGDLRYRDIYFGMASFVGQETVTAGGTVIWSMCYSGGVSPDISDRDTLRRIYAFLRKALLRIQEDQPYRGPPAFEEGTLRYENVVEGDISGFHGTERISMDGQQVYALRYAGLAIA